MTSLRFLADENLNERLVRGLLRRAGDLDLLRVRDTPRIGQSDAEILEFAATERRVILTHDVRTMPAAALARVKLGHSMPGVIVVSDTDSPGRILDDLELLGTVGRDEDCRDQVLFVPLRE